jgi:hypothetical protein
MISSIHSLNPIYLRPEIQAALAISVTVLAALTALYSMLTKKSDASPIEELKESTVTVIDVESEIPAEYLSDSALSKEKKAQEISIGIRASLKPSEIPGAFQKIAPGMRKWINSFSTVDFEKILKKNGVDEKKFLTTMSHQDRYNLMVKEKTPNTMPILKIAKHIVQEKKKLFSVRK